MKQEFRTPSTEIILSELHRPKNPSVSDSTTAIIVTEGDTENENIAKWKAGRQEWSIVACLLIINVVVVSGYARNRMQDMLNLDTGP
jgi:hypothetical protein